VYLKGYNKFDITLIHERNDFVEYLKISKVEYLKVSKNLARYRSETNLIGLL